MANTSILRRSPCAVGRVSLVPSVAKAIATHDSPGYQAALKALGDGAERDLRIVEGV